MSDVYSIEIPGLVPEYSRMLFRQVWPTRDQFVSEYSASSFNLPELDDKKNLIYDLLYASFANTPIVNDDVNYFKSRIFMTVFEYGPTWKKRLEVQQTLRGMSEEELRIGGRNVSNYAVNPNSAPATSSLDELNFVQQQTARGHKLSKAQAYATLLNLLEEDVTKFFVYQFVPCFSRFLKPEPGTPLYVNEED